MPVWDGAAVWDGSKTWGFTDASQTVLDDRTLWSPSVGVRRACFKVCTVDPNTLAFGSELPLLVQGGGRRTEVKNGRFQQDTLTFVVDDPTGRYLPGGDLFSLCEPGKLVGLKWEVSGGGVTRTYYGNVYRVSSRPVRSKGYGVLNPFTITAKDWLSNPLQQPMTSENLPITGVSPLVAAVIVKDLMLPLGSPVIGSPSSWATVAAALLYYLSGHRVRAEGDWNGNGHPTLDVMEGPLFTDPLTSETGSILPSWWKVFEYCAWLGRLTACYDGDGWVRVYEAQSRVDSGLYIGCDPSTAVGLLSPPVERISRDIKIPAFAAYLLYVKVTRSSGDIIWNEILPIAYVRSNSRDNPYIEGFSRTEYETYDGSLQHPVPSSEDADISARYAQSVLNRELADSDTLTIEVDSAFPFSNYIMKDVRVQVDKVASAYFRVVQVEQPFSSAPASVTLSWSGDV